MLIFFVTIYIYLNSNDENDERYLYLWKIDTTYTSYLILTQDNQSILVAFYVV